MPEPSHAPAATPATAPARGDDERPLDVVPGDLAVRVAQRLERGDLWSLQRQGARERDMQHECGDAEEDRPAPEAEHLELDELVFERPGRQLQALRDRAASAVRVRGADRRGDDRGADAPARASATRSLKPPSMSNAAATSRRSIQKIAKRRASGTISPGRIV